MRVSSVVIHRFVHLYEAQGVESLILQPPYQWAYIGCACRHGHIGLLKGVHQVDVDHIAHIHQTATGLHAFHRDGDLVHCFAAVQSERILTFGFSHDLICGLPQSFDLKYGDDLGQLEDGSVDVRDPMPVHEGGGGGQSSKESQFKGLLDLVDVR